MFKYAAAFSGFSVDNLKKAKDFYSKTLGVEVKEDDMGLTLKIAPGNNIYVYEKSDHIPATFTILNFVVTNIDKAVDELAKKGVKFEHYDSDQMKTDEKGIARGLSVNMGPDIAWFKDPAGNFLSVLQDK